MRNNEPQIQSISLQGLPEVLKQFDVNPDRFLENFDLSVADLILRNRKISYKLYVEILYRAATVCGVPHIGFLISRAESQALYYEVAIGVLLKYYDTLGDALDAIRRYYHAVSSGARYHLRREGKYVILIREGLIPGLKHDRILQDSSLSDFVTVIRKAVGNEWSPVCVYFSYDTPSDLQPYKHALGCPVDFSSGFQGIKMTVEDLEQPISISDSEMEQLARELVALSQEQSPTSFSNSVSQAIDTLLSTGVCCVNSVASIFDMHSRTLHRRLKLEGNTFAKLLDSRRREQAKLYLCDTSMLSVDVGLIIGYSAPEAFARAFRRWYGASPTEWRKEQARIDEGADTPD